jgi:hypothetical protein
MAQKAVFEGLVFDEALNPVEVVLVGGDACYVINDAGFRRHIDSEYVDRQVLNYMKSSIDGHESIISEQTAKMLGQDDIFSKAAIANQIKNIDKQMEALLTSGIPEEARTYLGMIGFRIMVNIHGDVLDIEQPGMINPTDEEE